MRKVLLLTVSALFCVLNASAQKRFEFNANCKEAYTAIVSLRTEYAKLLLTNEQRINPNNLIPVLLENYIDFYDLFLNEDPAVYKKRFPLFEDRLDQLEDGPEDDPWYLFSRALVQFQTAAVEAKFDHNWSAGLSFRAAFLNFKENQKSFPAFLPNTLFRGAMQVAAGTIPDGYKWLANLMGIKGTVSDGMAQMNKVLNATDEWSLLFREEGLFYQFYLKYYILNDRKEIFNSIQKELQKYPFNQLLLYLAVNLHLNTQHADIALKLIQQRKNSREYLPTLVWDFEEGYAKLYHLDIDAVNHLEKYATQFKGKYYIKDVLLKISWYYYLNGNTAKAEKYRLEVLRRGSLAAEADKQAQKQASNPKWPDPLLLKARLYSDGGYYMEALRLLFGKRYTDFKNTVDQIEFNYRVARIYDELGRTEEAIPFYKLAIQQGRERTEYFAARSALQLGMLFEARGQLTEALKWYQECLDMDNHDYKNSLDQRAKAGILRCGKTP